MDYSSGADRGLLGTGGSMLSTPNLLPFLAFLLSDDAALRKGVTMRANRLGPT